MAMQMIMVEIVTSLLESLKNQIVIYALYCWFFLESVKVYSRNAPSRKSIVILNNQGRHLESELKEKNKHDR